MTLQEIKVAQKTALDNAEGVVAACETAGRSMTSAENEKYTKHMDEFRSLGTTAKAREEQNTIKAMLGPNGVPNWVGGGNPNTAALATMIPGTTRVARVDASPVRLSTDYAEAFQAYVASNGSKLSAALYEGSNAAGGFAVPVTVEGQVVPLMPPETGIRSIATVIPTQNDIKIPRQTTISTAATKAEGTGNGSNVFTESEPVLDQFTLSAFMAGLLHQMSWELAQDVPSFQQFALGDMLVAQTLFEENLFINGTGTGQAQGIKGNVGTGTGVAVVAGSDNYATELVDATYDVQGTLKGGYFQNASWLMARSTGVFLRKAQKTLNLFTPIFERVGGKDYLHGFPITYSTSVDALAAGNTPLYFGDFSTGYVIGDRGGAGITIKILDQPKAVEGLLQFLAYRRTDGRVRRSEAIQSITIHA